MGPIKNLRQSYAMFDARAAKMLAPGEHITLSEHPGLRLESSVKAKSWIYRYKSPIDGRMRQIKLGVWPTKSYAAAAGEWEKLRQMRESGRDPALERKEEKRMERAAQNEVRQEAETAAYTVRVLCDEYLDGHIDPNRAKKGAAEIRRLFEKELNAIASLQPAEVTRSIAFSLIQSMAETKPVNAASLRAELGAAWDYAIDAGRLPEDVPNWWRVILRGKIKSKGKKIAGKHIGTAKRVLTETEIGVLINWLPNMSQMLQDTLTLYLWTCCRGAEIVQMEGREVVQEKTGLWWVIPKPKTKNRNHPDAADLRVPLFGRAAAIALRRKDRFGDGYLFPKRNDLSTHIAEKSIQSSLFVYQPYSEIRAHKYPIRLPVTHWAPHDLRRTSRTLLSSMGCPSDVAESIIGHMLPGVEGIYNLHKYDAERLEWLAKLSEKLESLATHSRSA